MFKKIKTWIFLIIAVAALWGGYVLFYKSTPKNMATTTADAIVMVDVKKAMQTGVWEYLCHPSKWKIDWSSDENKDTTLNWKDAVKLPDYITLFHEKNEDWGIWHTQLLVKDQGDFLRFMQQNKFETVGTNIFKSDSLKITVTKDGERVFVSSSNDLNAVNVIHKRLTIGKEDIKPEILDQLKMLGKHVSAFFAKGNTLAADAFASLQYSNNNIELTSSFSLLAPYLFNSIELPQAKDQMISAAFAQPQFDLAAALDSNAQVKFKNLLNVTAQSTLLRSNNYMALSLQKFAEKTDTAVTYTYDDDFNAIEKKEITKNNEPVFGIVINGPGADSILTNWELQKVIESNTKGKLFTSIPFAKSYCTVSPKQLQIATPDYISNNIAKEPCIFVCSIDVKKLYPNIEKYLPPDAQNILQKIIAIDVKAKLAEYNVVSLVGSIGLKLW